MTETWHSYCSHVANIPPPGDCLLSCLLISIHSTAWQVWNPSDDPFLPKSARYSLGTVTAGKAAAKALLQTRLGLTQAPDVPLFAFIGRLEEQKGADILIAALPLMFGPPAHHQAPIFHAVCPIPAPASAVLPLPVHPLVAVNALDVAAAAAVSVPRLVPLPAPPHPLPTLLPKPMQPQIVPHQAHLPPSQMTTVPTSSLLLLPQPLPPPTVPPHSTAKQHPLPQSPRQHIEITTPSREEVSPAAAASTSAVARTHPENHHSHPPQAQFEPQPQATASYPQLQLVMLGQGQPWMERSLSRLSSIYPGMAHGVPAFVEPLAHTIMAAADFVLVPSRLEPCGLVALIAARYGAVPVVSMVGGLADLMSDATAGPGCAVTTASRAAMCTALQQPWSEDSGLSADPWMLQPSQTMGTMGPGGGLYDNAPGVQTHALGYSLASPLGPAADPSCLRNDAQALAEAVRCAARQYGSSEYLSMQGACMEHDVSWGRPVAEWEKVISQLSLSDMHLE